MSKQNASLRFALSHGNQHRALHCRLEDIRLKEAFLALTVGFPNGRAAVPFRSSFDNCARAENPIPPKGQELRDFLRGLMLAAAATGNADIIARTKLQITRYLGELQAQAFAVAPTRDTPSLMTATVDAAKETSEALAAIAEAGTTRCPTAIERATRETDEAIVSLRMFKESSLATLNARRPAQAS